MQEKLSDPDFIKKSKLNYRFCNAKGLHEGEKLTLVCVDSKCPAKGLICPVCKETNHKDHNVMHIKFFLSQLQATVTPSTSTEDTDAEQHQKVKQGALANNLLLLETARKNLRKSLQESVNSFAQMIKQIEVKIQDNYLKVRRVILSQGALNNRLPAIYSMLLSNSEATESSYTDQDIEDEIKRCAGLMESKNNKASVIDDASKVVEQYSRQTESCVTHLMGVVSELSDRLKQLPLTIKSLVGLGKEKKNLKECRFNNNLRAQCIKIGQNGKTITFDGQNIGGMGYIFIDEANKQPDNKDSSVHRVSLKITGSVSESIIVGVGSPEILQNEGFLSQQIDVEGLFGICAMGINIADMDLPSFVFSQGDVLDLVLEQQLSRLTISRRNGVEKEEIYLGMSEMECKGLRFFVSLPSSGDSVEIVE